MTSQPVCLGSILGVAVWRDDTAPDKAETPFTFPVFEAWVKAQLPDRAMGIALNFQQAAELWRSLNQHGVVVQAPTAEDEAAGSEWIERHALSWGEVDLSALVESGG